MNIIALHRSIVRDGGASYEHKTDTLNPSEGFMVSPYKEAERALKGELRVLDLSFYIHGHRDLLNKPGHFLGAWLDQDTGTWYLDVSIRVETREEAVKLCQVHGQLGYWDCQAGEAVKVEA